MSLLGLRELPFGSTRSHRWAYDNFRLDIFVREVKDIVGGQVPDGKGPVLNAKQALRHFISTLKEWSNLPVMVLYKAMSSEPVCMLRTSALS